MFLSSIYRELQAFLKFRFILLSNLLTTKRSMLKNLSSLSFNMNFLKAKHKAATTVR